MNLSALLFLAALVVFVLALFIAPGVNLTLIGLALVAAGLAAGASGDTRIG